MPRLAVLSQYSRSETPSCSPASSPVAGVSSRSTSPLSPRHSAFSLVYPKEFHRNSRNYLVTGAEFGSGRTPSDWSSVAGMSALMYANSLMPAPYNPYVWHPIPGLFLPYNKMEALSPESANSAEAFTPEKVKIGKGNRN